MKAKQIFGVPDQKKGGFHDTESQQYFDNPLIAQQYFAKLKEKFFSVNEWKNFCNDTLADFKLFDLNGKPVNNIPKVGNFIRIDIPGPGNSESKGYDWVKITRIINEKEEDSERILIRCSPSVSPQNMNTHILHFYANTSTSTFIISLQNKTIKAAVYGRKETPNFNTTLPNKIRSLFIALGGIFGIAKIQWKHLTDGLLDF